MKICKMRFTESITFCKVTFPCKLAITSGGLGRIPFGEFEGNINNPNSNQSEGEGDNCSNVDIPCVDHTYLSDNFLNLKAISKLKIANKMSIVKTNELNGVFNPGKLGTMMAAPSHAADRLTSNSESSANQFGSGLDIRSDTSFFNESLSTASWTKVIYLIRTSLRNRCVIYPSTSRRVCVFFM